MLYHTVKRSLILPLLVLLLLTFLLVPPTGDFPQNDDWVHAKAVERLLEDGYYRGHPFCTSTMVGQVYWGALFAKVFGFDFNTLRLSTLVLSFFLAWGVALSAREMGATRGLAMLCGAIAWANPVVLVLSYSFMLDVPFLTMTALSGLYYLRGFRTGKMAHIALGTLFGGLSYTVRQPGLLVPIAYASACILLWLRYRARPNWRSIVAFAGPFIIGIPVFLWMTRFQEIGTTYETNILATGLVDGALRILHFCVVAMAYVGLFILPLGLAKLWQIARGQEPAGVVKYSLLVTYTVASFLLFWYPVFCRMPLYPSYFYDFGLGPITLHDVYIEHRTWKPFQIGKWWWLISLLSVLSAGVTLESMGRPIGGLLQPRTGGRHALRVKQGVFLVLWALMIVGSLKNPWLWPRDRYYIAGIPPCLVLVAATLRWRVSPGVRRVAYCGAVVLYACALAGTQDYMAWNRARWTAIDRLMSEYNAPVSSINGGYEYYGWYTSDDFMEQHHTGNFWDFYGDRDGRWIIDDTYVVGMMEPREGYEVLFRQPYFSWIGLETRDIIVFKRDGPE